MGWIFAMQQEPLDHELSLSILSRITIIAGTQVRIDYILHVLFKEILKSPVIVILAATLSVCVGLARYAEKGRV